MHDRLQIQVVAFPQEGIFSYPDGLALMEQAIEVGADVVGAIPHFEYTRELGEASLKEVIRLARDHDRLVDVHCDEIDDPSSRFLEVLAAEALFAEMGDRVTASHTTAMHSYDNAYCSKLFRLLKHSGINYFMSHRKHSLTGAVRYLSQATRTDSGEGAGCSWNQCLLC
nr:amidohydrolase family protein [Halomonas elongata]